MIFAQKDCLEYVDEPLKSEFFRAETCLLSVEQFYCEPIDRMFQNKDGAYFAALTKSVWQIKDIWHLRIKHREHFQSLPHSPHQGQMINVKKGIAHWTHWWTCLCSDWVGCSSEGGLFSTHHPCDCWEKYREHAISTKQDVPGEVQQMWGLWREREPSRDQVMTHWVEGMLRSELPGPHFIHHSLLRATFNLQCTPLPDRLYIVFCLLAQHSFFSHLWPCLTLQGRPNHISPTLLIQLRVQVFNTLMLCGWPGKTISFWTGC